MRQATIGIVSALVLACVAGASSAFLMTPVRAVPRSPWVRVADVRSLPEDGTPIRMAVVEHRRDAWTSLPDQKLGFVFLRRMPATGDVVALSDVTRHGSRVSFNGATRLFDDCCWRDWHFDLDGRCLPDPGLSDLVKLDVQVRDGSVYIANKLPRWGD